MSGSRIRVLERKVAYWERAIEKAQVFLERPLFRAYAEKAIARKQVFLNKARLDLEKAVRKGYKEPCPSISSQYAEVEGGG